MIATLLSLFLHVQIMSTDSFALRVDSCVKLSKCDVKDMANNPYDWHHDLIPVPNGIVCESIEAAIAASIWLKKVRPHSYFAGVKCVRIEGLMM